MTNQATWSMSSKCTKCGKPFVYIGDVFGDISHLICTCTDHSNYYTTRYSGVNFGTTVAPSVDLSRIEALLERIAIALESADWANKPTPNCAVCGEPTPFGTRAPYDSGHDDELVCGKCIDKLFNAKKAAT